MAIINGTSGNDTRTGTSLYDTISTGNGNDVVLALQGNDTVYAGSGSDTAWGGDGRDWLYGAAGRDSLYGDAGGDRIEGGNDNDFLYGGTGDDTAWGGNGADQAWGADGKDSLYGGNGADLLGGGNGDDLLQGGAGNDSLRGAAGTDTAVFSGAYAGYGIDRAGGLITVTDFDTTNGDDGTDRLIDVERLQFADRTITLRPLDLDVVLGYLEPVTQILVNGGGQQGSYEGTFSVVEQEIGAQATRAVALGDLDGDGDLDALLGNEGAANLVLLNAGGNAGDFVVSEAPGEDALTQAVALGDLDGDGDLDALVGNVGANQLLVNQGGDQGGNEGTFALGAGLPGGELFTTSVALGDLDGDGDLDALVGNAGDGIQLLLNQGGDQGGNEGDFLLGPAIAAVSVSTEALALGDLDGDGDLDALVGNAGAPLQALFNRSGAADFAAVPFAVADVVLEDLVAFDVALGDLDGDGDLDGVIGTYDDVLLLVNQGGVQGGVTGDFAFGATLTDDQPAANDVAVGDLDGDGDLDIVAATSLDGAVILYNAGGLQGGNEGDFLPALIDVGDLGFNASVALGDLDGDGTGGLTPAGLPVVGPGVPIAADPDWLA